MSSIDSLPVILVSAKTKEFADKLILEIVDNEVDVGKYTDGPTEVRVWRIVNKYYEADVLVHGLGDSDRVTVEEERVEGHVVYLAADEGAGEAARRLARAGAAAVRVAAADCARAPSALAAWAARARVQLLALREPPAPPPFPEPSGPPRVRAALHAHVWPGLRRTDRAPQPACDDSSSSDGGDDADEDEVEGEGAVERAEQFAAALGALGGGARHVASLRGAERRAAAEALVAAFARALGHDLDAC